MRLDIWQQDPDRACPPPINNDGTWRYSPVVEDQIALLKNRKLTVDQIEKEVEVLVDFMAVEDKMNEPAKCPVDIAEAIEDDRLSEWYLGAKPKKRTRRERIIEWQGGSPEFLPVDRVEDEDEDEEEEDNGECICEKSDFDFEECEACAGKGLNALVLDTATPEQVKKASARLEKQLKYERLRYETDEACRREAERDPVEDEEDDFVDQGYFDDYLGRWMYPDESDEEGAYARCDEYAFEYEDEEVAEEEEGKGEGDDELEAAFERGFDLGEGGETYGDEPEAESGWPVEDE